MSCSGRLLQEVFPAAPNRSAVTNEQFFGVPVTLGCHDLCDFISSLGLELALVDEVSDYCPCLRGSRKVS